MTSLQMCCVPARLLFARIAFVRAVPPVPMEEVHQRASQQEQIRPVARDMRPVLFEKKKHANESEPAMCDQCPLSKKNAPMSATMITAPINLRLPPLALAASECPVVWSWFMAISKKWSSRW